MDKKAVMSHFSSIIDDMIDNSLFFDTYWQEPISIEDIDGSYDDAAVPENIRIRFGATRGCIIDENYDYVVKFDVDEDGTTGSSCARECDIYAAAKQKNLHNYFCEVEFLGYYTKTFMFYDLEDITKQMDPYMYYDGKEYDDEFAKYEDDFGEIHPVTISVPLYGYRKAQPHWKPYQEIEEHNEYMSIAQKITSPMRERNIAVAIDFIRDYGREAYETVTEFMYEENINDLHGGNIGDINGHMVFFDFSGYHSTFSIDEEGSHTF